MSRACILLASLTLCLSCVGCDRVTQLGQARAQGSQGVTVSAQRMALEVNVPALGSLEAVTASPVAVPRVQTGALQVKELIPEGSLVDKGDVVIVFDGTALDIELENQQASRRSANRRIDKTQLQSQIESGTIEVMKEVAELERDNANMFAIEDESIYSKLEIFEMSVQKEEAEETILFADAAILLRGEYYDIEERILNVEKGQVDGKISRAEESLGKLVLLAPIGGMVVYKKDWRGGVVDVGDTLWPGNVVISIVDPASTALKAFVLEKDAAGVKEGAEAVVTIDARPGRSFAGRVKSIAELSRSIESGSPVKYSEVTIELTDGDPELLKPGMKGEAQIRVAELRDAVVVPRTCVRGEPDARYVWLETGHGAPEKRIVKLGQGDLGRVAIIEGLKGGEQLLIGAEPEEASEPASSQQIAPNNS